LHLRVLGQAASLAMQRDLFGQLVALLVVDTALLSRELCRVRPERSMALDVELVREPVTLDSLREELPFLGEAYAGDGPVADQLVHVSGWPSDREFGCSLDLQLAPVCKLGVGRDLLDQLLAVVVEPLLWVPAGGVQALQLELDSFRVGDVSGDVLAVKLGVVSQLLALASGAPA
jgi:hypothetical protein